MKTQMELGYTSPMCWLPCLAWLVNSFFSPIGAQSCWGRFENTLSDLKSGLAAFKGKGGCGKGLI